MNWVLIIVGILVAIMAGLFGGYLIRVLLLNRFPQLGNGERKALGWISVILIAVLVGWFLVPWLGSKNLPTTAQATTGTEETETVRALQTAVAELKAQKAEAPTTQLVTQGETCQKVFAYDRVPQPQIAHPSFYNETGVNTKTMCWEVELRDGFTLIIGGFVVDGVSGGVYKAIQGPANVNVRITDGFIAIVVKEVAEREFCFRLGQAVQYNWAHGTVEPLKGWTSCPVIGAQPKQEIKATATATPKPAQVQPTATPVPPTPATAAPAERRPSGERQAIQFNTGESVYGWEIELGDGRKCTAGECYLPSAPMAGKVTSGVVNPWDTEISAKAKANPWNP